MVLFDVLSNDAVGARGRYSCVNIWKRHERKGKTTRIWLKWVLITKAPSVQTRGPETRRSEATRFSWMRSSFPPSQRDPFPAWLSDPLRLGAREMRFPSNLQSVRDRLWLRFSFEIPARTFGKKATTSSCHAIWTRAKPPLRFFAVFWTRDSLAYCFTDAPRITQRNSQWAQLIGRQEKNNT